MKETIDENPPESIILDIELQHEHLTDSAFSFCGQAIAYKD
jgi:hypothetical protein